MKHFFIVSLIVLVAVICIAFSVGIPDAAAQVQTCVFPNPCS